MGGEIDYRVRLQLERAVDEFVRDEERNADRATDRFIVAFKCDGALDHEGRIIASWRDGKKAFEEIQRSVESINLAQSFTENLLSISSDDLRARLIVSDMLRARLLVYLCRFFDSSTVDEQFMTNQQWRADNLYQPADGFFQAKAYQLLRNQDQQTQTGTTADRQGAEPVKAGKAKSNTAKAAVCLFFDKHINNPDSKFSVLKVGQGRGKGVDVFSELWTMFKDEHPEWIKDENDLKSQGISSRDSFYTYLNTWREPTKN